MIGYFDTPQSGRVTLNDRGLFECDDPVVADYLNTMHMHGGVGDHHRPFGVASLARAAKEMGAEPVYNVAPYPPLPDGVIS